MASSYLNLYNNATSLRQSGALGPSTAYNPKTFPIGSMTNVYVAGGEENKIVHDTANNMYYGEQTQADLVKGLTDSIARINEQLKTPGETKYSNGLMGALNSQYYRYTDKDRVSQNNLLKQQQDYLNHINNGGYKQEMDQFFDSYDSYTGDWNNVFKRRKSNSDTLRRNDKITEENAVRDNKAKQQDTKVATGSVAKAKKLTPNLEINTGISAAADKLVQSLNKTGLGI
jgi:hypothetical protein